MTLQFEQPVPPPPGDALRAHLARGAARKPRRPLRDALVWSLCAAVGVVALIARFGVRPDVVVADLRWLAIAWALVAIGGAVATMLPPRGQVLPSVRRAHIVIIASVAMLAVVTVIFGHDGPLSVHHSGIAELHGIAHCEGLGVLMAAPLVGLAWAFVIRRVPVSAPVLGAAMGAAAGAVSGLVLNMICAVGGRTHALVGHVGVVILSAALGALLGALSSRVGRR